MILELFFVLLWLGASLEVLDRLKKSSYSNIEIAIIFLLSPLYLGQRIMRWGLKNG